MKVLDVKIQYERNKLTKLRQRARHTYNHNSTTSPKGCTIHQGPASPPQVTQTETSQSQPTSLPVQGPPGLQNTYSGLRLGVCPRIGDPEVPQGFPHNMATGESSLLSHDSTLALPPCWNSLPCASWRGSFGKPWLCAQTCWGPKPPPYSFHALTWSCCMRPEAPG